MGIHEMAIIIFLLWIVSMILKQFFLVFSSFTVLIDYEIKFSK